jgi:hypothetical protein
MQHSPASRTRSVHKARSAAGLLLALAIAACGASPFEVVGGRQDRTFISDSLVPQHAFALAPRLAAAPVEHDGLLYSARVVPVDADVGAGPMSLRIVVDVRNPGSDAVNLTVAGCTVWPEFYQPHVGSEPVWVPQGTCAQAPYNVSIGAGETRSLDFLAYEVMLAHGLDDGRYAVTALFRLPHTTLRLDAGTADVRLYVPNLAFHVLVDEAGGRPTATVRVENRNAVPVPLEWGNCAVGFELHRDADLADAPLRLERERVCLGYLAMDVVAAGAVLEAREFSYTPASHSGRNPELQPGTYHLVVALRLNWRTYRFPMGTLTVR